MHPMQMTLKLKHDYTGLERIWKSPMSGPQQLLLLVTGFMRAALADPTLEIILAQRSAAPPVDIDDEEGGEDDDVSRTV